MNITIPDELHERLQRVKDSINVSGICQEAISQIVSLEEAKMSATTAREAAIARLKVERDNANNQEFLAGKRQGLKDAVYLDYQCFQWLEYVLSEADPSPASADEWVINQLRGNDDLIDIAKMFACAELATKGVPALEERYALGWVKGVLEFWNDVKDEVL